MIKFSTIGQIEKVYAFEDAILEVDAHNGDFVSVAEGKAKPAADSMKVIMQKEVGDDAHKDKYPITAGSHVRVLDLELLDEQYPIKTVEIYGKQVPDKVKVGNKLKSDETGSLVTGGTKLEVTEIIGNSLGIEVKIISE